MCHSCVELYRSMESKDNRNHEQNWPGVTGEKIQKSYDGLFRYFTFYKWAPLKIEKIMKQAGPSRQLFETVNFAFMKNFDFLVKIAIFWAFLLFLG